MVGRGNWEGRQGGGGGGAHGDDPCGQQDDDEDDDEGARHHDDQDQLTLLLVAAAVLLVIGALQPYARLPELLGLGEREEGGQLRGPPGMGGYPWDRPAAWGELEARAHRGGGEHRGPRFCTGSAPF